jgi:hypothetical protein
MHKKINKDLAQNWILWNVKCVSDKCKRKWMKGEKFEQTYEAKDG